MFNRRQRLFVFLVLAIVLIFFTYFLGSHFLPFILGGIFSLCIEPLVVLLERHLKLPRKLASLFVLIVVVMVLAGLALTIPALVASEILRLAEKLMSSTQELQRQIGFLTNHLQLFTLKFPPFLFEWWQREMARAGQALSSEMLVFSRKLIGFAIGLPGKIIMLLFAFLASYFLSAGLPVYRQRIRLALPESWRELVGNLARSVFVALIGFLRAQLILTGAVALVLLAGLLIAGAPYALAVALLAAPCSILPLVGTGLVLVPWAIWAAVSGNSLMAAELLGLMVVAALVRHTLEPKVLGDEVGLSPLAILVIVYVGYDVMGLKGVFLGLVLGVTYKAIITEERIPADSEKKR
ncbi:sporulation integral membrane protein YtvI [Desulfofundulus thermobenzoicus]|uniref:Sporulation integral membrane protein YtvI n=1 Tax=Desulfofundulus thermobenzoicus TaxID=29376 RepID=A0A6N7ITB2_9FIRM|nr:sporulation integral membrane protein YtvI [Desulfofundulus thermobenzoicus]MQL53300.1 sporulation integral membrane protein YtvI [Desulfofundulus thermobenzoicus]